MEDGSKLIKSNGTNGIGRYYATSTTDTSDVERDNGTQHYPMCPLFRLLVSFISSVCYASNFASQAIVSASLFLMIRHDNDVRTNVSAGTPQPFKRAFQGDNRSDFFPGTPSDSNGEWRFPWTNAQYAWLVTVYFLGFYVIQLPAGWTTARFGGHRVNVVSTALTIICNGLSILVPHYGPESFGVLLFLSGVVNAFRPPAILQALSSWCPSHESSRLMAIFCSGASVGIGYAYMVSTISSKVDLIGGWPFNFIIMIATDLVCLFMWVTFVTNTPDENKLVQKPEKAYIQDRFLAHGAKLRTARPVKTPWLKITTSLPMYAICVHLFGSDWLTYSYISVFPNYFSGVRKMSVTMVTLVSGLPFCFNPFASFAISAVVDALRQRQRFSTTFLRKSADAIGKLVCMFLLLGTSFLPKENTTFAAVLYSLAMNVLMGFQGSIWAVNITELCPDYVGIVTTVVQLFAFPVSFITPLVFSAVVPNGTEEEWQMYFIVTSAVCAVSSFIYIVFGTSQEQDWED